LRSGRRPDGTVFAQAKTVTSKMWRSPERAEGERSANPMLCAVTSADFRGTAGARDGGG